MKSTKSHVTGGMTVIHPPPLRPVRGEAGLTLLSDPHLGAANADVELLKRELDRAAQTNDRVLLNGDVFDLILAKDQKRFAPGVLHPRLRGCDDLVNRAVDWAEELLAPHADRVDLIAQGNHETAVLKHHSIDPTALLVERLRRKNPHVAHGGYQGLVRYTFPGVKRPFVLFYWHGAGGGAGLGGVLGEFGGKGTFVEGADAAWLGHKHCRAVSQLEKLSCPAKGHRPRLRTQWLLRTGGYLAPYAGQSQRHRTKHGVRSNYSADSLHTPFGRGGLRLVLSPSSPSRVEIT